MREAEFIQLLDRVDAALNTPSFSVDYGVPMLSPVAANDNDEPWDHEPFPDGWIASC